MLIFLYAHWILVFLFLLYESLDVRVAMMCVCACPPFFSSLFQSIYLRIVKRNNRNLCMFWQGNIRVSTLIILSCVADSKKEYAVKWIIYKTTRWHITITELWRIYIYTYTRYSFWLYWKIYFVVFFSLIHKFNYWNF